MRALNTETVKAVFFKDVRHTHRYLIFWMLVLVVGTAADIFLDALPLYSYFFLPGGMFLTYSFPAWSASLMGMAILPLIVQSDAVDGPAAFWRTQPIAKSDLLLAKLLYGMVFFVLSPVVAELVVHLSYEVSALLLPDILLESLLAHLLGVLLIVLIAAHTPTLGSYAVILFTLLGSGGLILMTLYALLLEMLGEGPTSWATLLLLLTISGRGVLQKYLRQKNNVKRSLGLAVASLMVAKLTYGGPELSSHLPTGYCDTGCSVRIEWEHARLQSTYDSSVEVLAPYQFLDTWPEVFGEARSVSMYYPAIQAGGAKSKRSQIYSSLVDQQDLATALGRAIPERPIISYTPAPGELPILQGASDYVKPLFGQQLRLSGKIRYDAYRPYHVGRTAFKDAARLPAGDQIHHFKAGEVGPQEISLSVLTRSWNISRLGTARRFMDISSKHEKEYFVLLNLSSNEFILGTLERSYGRPAGNIVPRLYQHSETLVFSDSAAQVSQVLFSEEWLKNAVIVKLKAKPVAHGTVALHEEDVRLPPL